MTTILPLSSHISFRSINQSYIYISRMATSLTDIHSDIILTHILPCLDGPSLATTTALSSYLQNLCIDDNIWKRVCKSTWPSSTHPRVQEIISAFPYGYRTFFHDAFPVLVINRSMWKQDQQLNCLTSYPGLSELVSAIDIHYKNDIVYSAVKLTNTSTKHFLWSPLWIELTNDQTIINRSIDLKVDDNIGEETLLQLKESLTLNWVVMSTSWKRAGNLSSVKPVRVKEGLLPNEILVQYKTILPGCDPKEMVQCKIHLVLEGEVAAGLQVKMVILKLQNLNSICLKGNDFLVVTQRAIMEQNQVIRKMVANNDQDTMMTCKEFKEMKRKEKEIQKDIAVKNRYTDIFVFCICVYYLVLILHFLGPGSLG
uniref:F-box protein At2g27310-like n=1 Tax=Erigeron canadensis TaxID=72917 RepID=UPI001CB94AAC|nr:F-box protein At2g27310-like [Erigeron canadensis]